jgi:hypothetical protein
MDIKPNLELDLFKSNKIVEKCKDKIYAQNLYAALCNNVFLKGGYQWTCSWRTSGGIIADLRSCGEDYIDWYCSGIGVKDDSGLMHEGCISSEVYTDLSELGWAIEPYDCAEDIL